MIYNQYILFVISLKFLDKTEKKRDVINYRSVAILPTIAKLSNHFKNYLSVNHCFMRGFMSGRSTVTNMIKFEPYGLNVIEPRKQVDVGTDFRKAFYSKTGKNWYNIR